MLDALDREVLAHTLRESNEKAQAVRKHVTEVPPTSITAAEKSDRIAAAWTLLTRSREVVRANTVTRSEADSRRASEYMNAAYNSTVGLLLASLNERLGRAVSSGPLSDPKPVALRSLDLSLQSSCIATLEQLSDSLRHTLHVLQVEKTRVERRQQFSNGEVSSLASVECPTEESGLLYKTRSLSRRDLSAESDKKPSTISDIAFEPFDQSLLLVDTANAKLKRVREYYPSKSDARFSCECVYESLAGPLVGLCPMRVNEFRGYVATLLCSDRIANSVGDEEVEFGPRRLLLLYRHSASGAFREVESVLLPDYSDALHGFVAQQNDGCLLVTARGFHAIHKYRPARRAGAVRLERDASDKGYFSLPHAVVCAAYSPTSDFLAVGLSDASIRLLAGAERTQVRQVREMGLEPDCVAFASADFERVNGVSAAGGGGGDSQSIGGGGEEPDETDISLLAANFEPRSECHSVELVDPLRSRRVVLLPPKHRVRCVTAYRMARERRLALFDDTASRLVLYVFK